ncbi:MAG TPA: toll/interleukin-1 receptor domain-containing protein [Dehalococcoidia bacterium]|nr:toll/interleukin-1 receptor domain-containing protein [Dehalococcoidia bacterium]
MADLLEAQGIPVWIDRHSIAGGATWSAQIGRGIRGCAVVAVLVGPEDRVRLADIHYWLGRVLYIHQDPRAAGAHLEQALAAARVAGREEYAQRKRQD